MNQTGFYVRGDTVLPNGKSPGTEYEAMRRFLLDDVSPFRILLNFDVGLESGYYNPYFAAALCRAANQWSVERWLDLPDDRLRGSLLIPTEIAEDAIAEIRRWAGHPKISQVLLVGNPLGRPFGHPHYHAIYAVAEEVGLPISIHIGGEKATKSAYSAGGHVGSYFERRASGNQAGMHHLTSMITHGVFEKFPKLKLMLTEFGFAWLPAVMWRLESIYEVLRVESPIVKRRPMEYLLEHVHLSTQPLDTEDLGGLFETFPEFEDLLCFATDFPHFDGDDPRLLTSQMPKSWLPKVFCENAAAHYGWEVPSLTLLGDGAPHAG